jgi:hypothetical protein
MNHAMLLSLQEMPVTMNLGYQHSVSRKSGIATEVHQCVEFLEWQSTRDDFREMTRKIYKSELKAQQKCSFFTHLPAATYEPFCNIYYKHCTFY